MKFLQHHFLSLILLVALSLFTACRKDKAAEPLSQVGEAKTFSPADDEATLINKGVLSVSIGKTSYYIGYQQVSANNQDPIMAKFVDGVQQWVRSDYETSNDDGKGYGLIWDGKDALYAVFSATGTQGQPSQDFRRFAQNGWLSSYGSGGGPRVAILAKINPDSGVPQQATYLYSKLSNGNSNSMLVKTLQLNKVGELIVTADAWFSPLKTDKQPFSCSGNSPFVYTVSFDANLTTALSAEAEGCNP